MEAARFRTGGWAVNTVEFIEEMLERLEHMPHGSQVGAENIAGTLHRRKRTYSLLRRIISDQGRCIVKLA